MGNPTKPAVHKLKATQTHGNVAMCGRTVHTHVTTKYWSDVTYTNCLKQHKEPIDG